MALGGVGGDIRFCKYFLLFFGYASATPGEALAVWKSVFGYKEEHVHVQGLRGVGWVRLSILYESTLVFFVTFIARVSGHAIIFNWESCKTLSVLSLLSDPYTNPVGVGCLEGFFLHLYVCILVIR